MNVSLTPALEELLRGGGFASARAVNAELWGSPVGMVKRQRCGSRG